MKRRLLLMLAILLLCAIPSALAAERVVFFHDLSVLDLKRDSGAHGDGVTDDVAKDDHRPAFEVVDASFSAAGIRELSFGNTYPVKVREHRGAAVRTEKGGGCIGWA